MASGHVPYGWRRIYQYFGKPSEPPSIDDLRSELWAAAPLDDNASSQSDVTYSIVLLEQYKLYVEMADRISARRGLTNTFFLTLNSAIFTLLGIALSGHKAPVTWALAFPVIALVGQCMAWFWLIRSYRQLNTAKFLVVGALEERLPASPYWRAEWKALGEGKNPSLYWPLSHLEQWVPILFALFYLGSFFIVLTEAAH